MAQQILEIVQQILQSKTLTPQLEAEINQVLRGGQVSDSGLQALEMLLQALREGQIQRVEPVEAE